MAQLILTVAPLIFSVAPAFTSRPAAASNLASVDALISSFCASSLIVPCGADKLMSLSLLMVMVLLAVSKTMRFFSLLSMISI